MQWRKLLSWEVTQGCWVTLVHFRQLRLMFYHSGVLLVWMKCWSNPTCSAEYSCLVQNLHCHEPGKQETSLSVGSCEPLHHRRTNAWFRIQVYSCCSMFFPIAMSSILFINSVKWRPIFLQQGLCIQHKRSGSSCSPCSPWLCLGILKLSPALTAATCEWEILPGSVCCALPRSVRGKEGQSTIIHSFSLTPHHKVWLFSCCFCSFSP